MGKKIAVVTGATSGLGYETAKALAGKGMKVLMLGRNETKLKNAIQNIQSSNNKAELVYVVVDLSKQKDMLAATEKIKTLTNHIDVLVNNAGTWFSERKLTEDGIETVFAVNHLSYFYLTSLLYPRLKQAKEARIINVGSDSHFQGSMNFDDLYLSNNYHGLRSYAQSKLANLLFTYQFDLLKPDRNVSINCVQPGLVKTDIGVKHTTWLHRFAWKVRRSGGVSPAVGAETQIYLASSPEVQGVSGKYWDKCRPKSSSKKSYKESDAKKLWKISMDLCKIDDYFGRRS